MKPHGESKSTGGLRDARKDIIAGGIFLGLSIAALVYLRVHHLPIGAPIHQITILKDFSRDLFIFKRR
ncbi:MAG: hypothetical protein M0Z41_04160 [Peptococcaceae bacterium]|jgi:hypothetical protein|nr:hypothetical protein [Peptococcaceae bacterium]